MKADDDQANAGAQGAAHAATTRGGAVRADALAPRLATQGGRQAIARSLPPDRNTPATPPKQINVSVEYELQYWSRALRVSRSDLVAAVEAVGPSARAVSRVLGKG